MINYLLKILFILLLCSGLRPLFAYQLTSILSIAQSEHTFLVRLGMEKNIEPGTEATFSSRHVTIAAKAIEVSKEFSVWKVMDPRIKIPFEREQIVVLNTGTERVWMLDPDEYMSEKLLAKWESDLKRRNQFHNDIYIRASATSGITGTISDTSAQEIISREGIQLDLLFQQVIFNHFVGGIGGRMEKEDADFTAVTTSNYRGFFLLHTSYYFIPFDDSPGTSLYFGLEVGAGPSYTKIGEYTSKGYAYIFPGIHVGADFLFGEKGKSFSIEGGLETISTSETINDSNIPQKSNLLNGKISLGFRQYF